MFDDAADRWRVMNANMQLIAQRAAWTVKEL